MIIEVSNHAMSRSMERLGLTGVELTKLVYDKVKASAIKTTSKKYYRIKLKRANITLIMCKNKVITVYKTYQK